MSDMKTKQQRCLADVAMSGAVGEGSYSFEREDEFYASLVLKSRKASPSSSPTHQNIKFAYI